MRETIHHFSYSLLQQNREMQNTFHNVELLKTWMLLINTSSEVIILAWLDHHSHKQNILWQALFSHCLLRMNINVNLKRSNALCVVKTDFTDSCGSVFEGRNRWESQSSRWVAVNIYWLIAFKAEENWKFRFHFRMIISLMIAHCQQRYLKLKFLWMNHVEQCVLF